jgi:hypothetical protein
MADGEWLMVMADGKPSTLAINHSHQPSTISHQPSTMSHQRFS